jgi:hypothetical protein
MSSAPVGWSRSRRICTDDRQQPGGRLGVRDSEIPGGGFPEMLLQKGERFRSQIRARLNEPAAAS